jgi:hypothetical protein
MILFDFISNYLIHSEFIQMLTNIFWICLELCTLLHCRTLPHTAGQLHTATHCRTLSDSCTLQYIVARNATRGCAHRHTLNELECRTPHTAHCAHRIQSHTVWIRYFFLNVHEFMWICVHTCAFMWILNESKHFFLNVYEFAWIKVWFYLILFKIISNHSDFLQMYTNIVWICLKICAHFRTAAHCPTLPYC